MGVHLGRLAVGAPQDELSQESRHSGPPVVFLHAVQCLKESFVSSHEGFMKGFHELMAGWFRNVEAVFEI